MLLFAIVAIRNSCDSMNYQLKHKLYFSCNIWLYHSW